MAKLRDWMVGATLACLWACGSPEQSTVDQFFRAAQTDDSSTLASMAAVGPPVPVQSWEVVEVSSRSTEPFTLPELIDQFKAAEKERDAALEERKQYFEENQEALEQIIPKLREDPDYKFSGRLGEVQEEWLRLLDERKDKEGKFQELKRTLARERGLATKSLMRQVKLESLDGDVAVTEMLLNLKPQDASDQLPFKVTLRKYDLMNPETNRLEPARWIVSDIEGATPEARAAASKPAEASAPAPESVAAPEAPEVAEEQGVAESEQQPAPAAESQQPAQTAASYRPRELHGPAEVQILTPETKVEGGEVVSTIRARNMSRGWLTRFTVTEHWYDEQGNAMRGSSRTHPGRFMPGEVIEIELRTAQDPNFYQNQFEFSHANGQVETTIVGSFPTSSEE